MSRGAGAFRFVFGALESHGLRLDIQPGKVFRRRLLLSAEIPSARARQEVQDLLRIQREQCRLGGLLKKALTEREEKAALRRTLIEVERNAAELRRVIAHLVRSG